MHTEHIKYLLPDYVTGRLEPDLQNGVEAHLNTCQECVAEMKNLQEILRKISQDKPYAPATMYFNALLPRIRQRLDAKRKQSVWAHPVFVRVVAPLAVAVLAIVMLSRMPFPAEQQDPLKSIVADVSTDELEQVVLEQVQRQPGGMLFTENELAMLPSGRSLEQQLQSIAKGTSWIDSEPAPNNGILSGIDELSDSELETLLQRLGERAIL